jgi:hypothetical protein
MTACYVTREALTAACVEVFGPWFDAGQESGHYSPRVLADAIFALLPASPDQLRERLLAVRMFLIDAMGTELSAEFAQDNPFEPFDRVYVLKVITRIFNDARKRAALAAREAGK